MAWKFNPFTGQFDLTAEEAISLTDIDDVTITSVSDLDLLQYDSATSNWVNRDISTILNGTYLKLDGSNANSNIDIGSYDFTTTGTGTFDYIVETTPTLLKLDQTTPQTVINGVPLLNTTPNGSADLKSFVNKEYVDLAVTSLGASYYMYDEDDATGYKTCYLNPSGDAETYIEGAGLSDNDYLGGWISAPGEAPTKLLKGIYDWFLTTEKTTGTKDLRVYWTLIERKADTSEVVIATSSNSNIITDKESYLVPLQLTEDYIPDSGSRIIGKLYADVSGGGNAPTIRIYYQGETSSRWEIPANSEIFQNIFVPYSGAVQNVDLGDKDFTTTGSTTTDDLTLTIGDNDNFKFYESPDNVHELLIQNQVSGALSRIAIKTKDNDGTDHNYLRIYGDTGENLLMGYSNTGMYVLGTNADPLKLYSAGNTDQLNLQTDGDVYMKNGLKIADGIYSATEGWMSIDTQGGDIYSGFDGNLAVSASSFGLFYTGDPILFWGDQEWGDDPYVDIKTRVLFEDELRIKNDNKKIYIGAGDDASIYYSGTGMVINPKEIGSGGLSVLGDITTTGAVNAGTITATGNGTFDELTITNSTQNYKFAESLYTDDILTLESQSSGVNFDMQFLTKDKDGTDKIRLFFYNKGQRGVTDYERLAIAKTNTQASILVQAGGTGVKRSFYLNANGIDIDSDGTLNLEAGTTGVRSTTIYNDTTSNSPNVYISGTGWLQHSSVSSKRYKENIQDINNSEVIYQLRPVTFNSKCEDDDPNKLYYGLIAEEIQKTIPSAVYLNDKGEVEGYDFQMIMALMLKEIQRLKVRIDELERK